MNKVNTREELEELLSRKQAPEENLGLVPTMGALHEGHLSLVEKAYSACETVVVSIFVNPTQFDNPSDLEKYPRNLEKDLAVLKRRFEEIIVFMPKVSELYGENVTSEHFDFEGLEQQMEGKYRDGHFDGVGTVLKLLFDIIKPDKAFFGEKDFQQLQVVKKLVKITEQPVEVVGCPIMREENGLAMSSRNKRLSKQEFEEAAFIYQTLKGIKSKFNTKNGTFAVDWAREEFKKNSYLDLEYMEIADEDTLKPIGQRQKDKKYRAFIAAYAGNVRLIDNLAL